jgi:biotin synthase-like enzyme
VPCLCGAACRFCTNSASTNAEVQSYFLADDYVREGYMLAKAERAHSAAVLHNDGIDPNAIEEVRILQVGR